MRSAACRIRQTEQLLGAALQARTLGRHACSDVLTRVRVLVRHFRPGLPAREGRKVSPRPAVVMQIVRARLDMQQGHICVLEQLECLREHEVAGGDAVHQRWGLASHGSTAHPRAGPVPEAERGVGRDEPAGIRAPPGRTADALLLQGCRRASGRDGGASAQATDSTAASRRDVMTKTMCRARLATTPGGDVSIGELDPCRESTVP